MHQHSSWSGLRNLCSSEDPSGNLDWPVSRSPPDAGKTAVWSGQEHPTPVGGKEGRALYLCVHPRLPHGFVHLCNKCH